MSTKSSIAYGENFHFYEEVFENEGLYLQVNGEDAYYEIYPGSYTVRIPGDVLRAILYASDEIKKRLDRDDSGAV